MTTTARPPDDRDHTQVPSSSGRAVGRLAMSQVRRGALIVTAVCAGMSAVVAVQYQATFEGALDESGLRALAENPAIRILFGAPIALDDAGGFTVWRTGTPLLVLASVWILLAATRITRGEEDAGRWDLLLSGRLRATDVVVRYLTALGGCALVISVAIGASLLAAGTDATGAAVYAAAILGVTLTFASIGVFAPQVMPTRSAAVGVGVAVLFVGLLLRMLADGVPLLAWSAWTTPFGLIARAAPYADNRIAPLLVLIAVPIMLAATALAASRSRDVGSGLVSVSTSRPPRIGLLGSIGGFALRRGARSTIGWVAGVVAYFLLFGGLIASILEFMGKNPRFAELAAAAGVGGLDSANGFAAALFGVLAIPTGLYAYDPTCRHGGRREGRRWTPLSPHRYRERAWRAPRSR